jgi:hypothetical protein
VNLKTNDLQEIKNLDDKSVITSKMRAAFSQISFVNKKFGFSELTSSQYLTIVSFSRSNSGCLVPFLREDIGIL